MAAVKIRYVYETSFFDGRGPGWGASAAAAAATAAQQQPDPPDQVDSAINHPIVRRIQQAVIRARKAVASGISSQHIDDLMARSDDGGGASSRTPPFVRQHRSAMSSLQTSMCSLDDDESVADDGRLFLNRSRSLQQTHLLHHQSSVDSQHPHRGFSLHLSPKQRTRIGEAVLSPISDKSENETSQMLLAAQPAVHPTIEFNPTIRRRPQSLFPAIIRPGGGTFNSSDSGISISANSLAASHEALQPSQHKPTHLSLNNSHEFLSSSSSSEPPPEENLPFLMPKLRRAAAGFHNNGVFQPPATGPVRQLSLTLPFPPSLQSLPFVAPAVGFQVLVDDTVPLETQSWYHGSITRRDAEKRLRPAPAGSFLVRDSMASHDDYFLAARGENGFLHVRIDCNWQDDSSHATKDFTLATLPERRFQSVAAAVNHCANIGIYSTRLPPVVLKYPLAEEPV